MGPGESDASPLDRRVPQDILDRWAFDIDVLMPLDADDLQVLHNNTVVQIWLFRVRKRRQARMESILRGSPTNRKLQRQRLVQKRVPEHHGYHVAQAAKAAKAVRVARASLCAPPPDPASVEALLARPFAVQESDELKPILSAGEGCSQDLWVLSKSYWLETILDADEFSKWAEMVVRQHNRVRKAAGIIAFCMEPSQEGSTSPVSSSGVPSPRGELKASNTLQAIEEKRLHRGSLPFAVPLPVRPPDEPRAAESHRQAPLGGFHHRFRHMPRAPVELPSQRPGSMTFRHPALRPLAEEDSGAQTVR